MSTTLSLLQLNIEYGGTGVDFDAVIRVIQQVWRLRSSRCRRGAATSRGSRPRSAGRTSTTGPRWCRGTRCSTRPSPTAGVILVELEPGRVIAIVNVHPASRRYGPFRLMKGDPPRRVRRIERRVRVADLQPSLDAAETLIARGRAGRAAR